MRRLAVALLVVVAACGRDAAPLAPPPDLPVSSVPAALELGGEKLVVQRNDSPSTARAFRSVGKASLVERAAVWEVRRSDRLVGTLQLTTLRAGRMRTTDAGDRDDVRDQILANPSTLDFDGLPVWSGTDGDRAVFVWFGRQVLSVLQLRTDVIDAEEAAAQMITAVVDSTSWPALPPEAFEEDES